METRNDPTKWDVDIKKLRERKATKSCNAEWILDFLERKKNDREH